MRWTKPWESKRHKNIQKQIKNNIKKNNLTNTGKNIMKRPMLNHAACFVAQSNPTKRHHFWGYGGYFSHLPSKAPQPRNCDRRMTGCASEGTKGAKRQNAWGLGGMKGGWCVCGWGPENEVPREMEASLACFSNRSSASNQWIHENGFLVSIAVCNWNRMETSIWAMPCARWVLPSPN